MKVSYPEIDKIFENMDSKTFTQAINNGTMPTKPPKKATKKKSTAEKKKTK